MIKAVSKMFVEAWSDQFHHLALSRGRFGGGGGGEVAFWNRKMQRKLLRR